MGFTGSQTAPSPIGVALVDDDVAQVGEDAREPGVDGKHALVQHVRVGDEQLRPLPHRAPLRLHVSNHHCL